MPRKRSLLTTTKNRVHRDPGRNRHHTCTWDLHRCHVSAKPAAPHPIWRPEKLTERSRWRSLKTLLLYKNCVHFAISRSRNRDKTRADADRQTARQQRKRSSFGSAADLGGAIPHRDRDMVGERTEQRSDASRDKGHTVAESPGLPQERHSFSFRQHPQLLQPNENAVRSSVYNPSRTPLALYLVRFCSVSGLHSEWICCRPVWYGFPARFLARSMLGVRLSVHADGTRDLPFCSLGPGPRYIRQGSPYRHHHAILLAATDDLIIQSYGTPPRMACGRGAECRTVMYL